ncbi:MAG: ParB N-terminal domain-containing protein [Candidatus Kapaibacteriota bacterium]|jgi:ParB-like chromosome segregation protein Spo0J
MARFKPDTTNDIERSPKQFLSGTNLSDVQKVERSKLRPNPKNGEYFISESAEYFERLEQDIRDRGILVPLLAKEDGTLLAGHNRLIVAEKLNLKFVPVQYVKQQISESEEQSFVIKDNLLRRQFSGSEWLQIYRRLYPDFEERIADGNKAGKPKAKALTASIIAKDTGQKVEAVRKQLQRGKASAKMSKLDTVQLSKSNSNKNPKLDTVQLSKTPTQKSSIVRTARKLLDGWGEASEAEQKEVLKILRTVLQAKKPAKKLKP